MLQSPFVIISGKVYSVEFVPSDHPDLEESDGRIFHDQQRILVNKELHPESQIETVLHEVNHGIENAGGLNLKENDVLVFSRLQFAAMRQNPDLVRWVMGWE